MPRSARKQSESGLYHIMLRGNAQRQIFQDEEDNREFLRVLGLCKATSGFQVYAYCLMGNHVHLTIRTLENGEALGQIFRRLGAQYVYWYNGKYSRVGHLFQDRYKSEPITDDEYMMAVLRYVHNNPVKAGMVSDISGYPYSSYREYVDPKEGQITDVEFVLQIMDRRRFIAFHGERDDIQYMDLPQIRVRLSDEQAKREMMKACQCESVEGFQAMSRGQRVAALKTLKEKGLSFRQLNRLTGESVGFIQRVVGYE